MWHDHSRGRSRMLQILFLRYWQRKSSNYFALSWFQRCWIAHNSVIRYPILMGVASKCDILKLLEGGVKISKFKIFDMWLVSLDHVTFMNINNTDVLTTFHQKMYITIDTGHWIIRAKLHYKSKIIWLSMLKSAIV